MSIFKNLAIPEINNDHVTEIEIHISQLDMQIAKDPTSASLQKAKINLFDVKSLLQKLMLQEQLGKTIANARASELAVSEAIAPAAPKLFNLTPSVPLEKPTYVAPLNGA